MTSFAPLRARALAGLGSAGLAAELARLGHSPADASRLSWQGMHRCIRVDGLSAPAARRAAEVSAGTGATVAAGTGAAEAAGTGGAMVMGSAAALRELARRLQAAADPELGALAAALEAVCRHTLDRTAPVLAAPCGWPDYAWEFGRRTYVMSILNVTPDSFSDDGLDTDLEAAFARARQHAADGADVIDVGGESSEAREHRPVPWQEEAERVVPVVQYIREHLPGMLVSVDTWKAPVAAAALAAGAHLINDVGAMRRDPEMRGVAAQYGCPIIVMHDQAATHYDDIMADIPRFFCEVIESGARAGVAPEQIMIDAGFGFGKSVHQDLLVTRRLRELTSLGRPILHAPSRKRTIGRVLGYPDTVEERLLGTAAAVTAGIAAGADMVRVHDVLDMVRCVQVSDAILRAEL